MGFIFIKEPIIAILSIIIALLDFAAAYSARKQFKITSIIITAVNIILHIVCLSLIMLYGGGYENALILVLLSCVITLAVSPKPKKNNDSGVEL